MKRLLRHPVTERARRYLRLAVVAVAVLLAVALVSAFAVDLGPALKPLAETYGSRFIKRPMHIGRLSVHLWRGSFVFEDFVIEGLTPQGRPFLRARRVALSNGQLRVEGDQDAIVVSGPIRAGSSEIDTVRWTERLRPAARADSEYDIADQFDANEGKKSQADKLVHGWSGKHALTWRVGNCQRGLVTDLGQWPFSSRSSHRSRPHCGQSVKFHRWKRVVPLVHDNFLPVLA